MLKVSTIFVQADQDKRVEKLLRWGAALAISAATFGLLAVLARERKPEPGYAESSETGDQQSSESDSNSVDSSPTENEASSQISSGSLVLEGIELFGLTHTGNLRSNNQDTFRILPLPNLGPDYALLLVCDGMGGHAGGEVASDIAANIIASGLDRQRSSDPRELYEALESALKRADAAIEMRSSKQRELQGMGTTAVAAVIHRRGYVHCHIGDSRLYHLAGQELVYQTKDHSVVRYLLEEGIISESEAKEHPYRSHLTSSLGGGKEANRLTIEPQWSDTTSPLRSWAPGDCLLLCSDGLNSELGENEIVRHLIGAQDSKTAAHKLLAKTLEAGARDNVTIIVATHH